MTSDEVIGVLSYLAEAYPQASPPEDPSRRVAVWLDILRPYSGEDVLAAARSYVRGGNKWFPTPAELLGLVNDRALGAVPSEIEAWATCTSHVSGEERRRLHPVLREVLSITGGIQTISWMDEKDGRRAVRGAYYSALREFEIQCDPELRRAPDRERLGGGLRNMAGELAE